MYIYIYAYTEYDVYIYIYIHINVYLFIRVTPRLTIGEQRRLAQPLRLSFRSAVFSTFQRVLLEVEVGTAMFHVAALLSFLLTAFPTLRCIFLETDVSFRIFRSHAGPESEFGGLKAASKHQYLTRMLIIKVGVNSCSCWSQQGGQKKTVLSTRQGPVSGKGKFGR